jgi:2-polyprenyl-3-methyl-5-hydroxy-6-metoxy-1,4-benzoquinol methylase
MERAYAAVYGDTYRRHWWFRARERFIIRRIQRLGLRDARILDVGCGDALFFPALEPFGAVAGVEPDASVVSAATRRAGRVHVGPFEGFAGTPGGYDLILMLDVLEHVDDPAAALRHAAELVRRPAGTLLVTVPALPWLWTSHDAVNHHRRRYRRDELGAALRAAGFEPLDLRYLFSGLVAPKLAVRALERLGTRSVDETALPAPRLNRLLERATGALLRIEEVVAPPLGTSVFAEARPR